MELEFESLVHNKTWELVPLPRDCKSTGYKWIYNIKYNAHGCSGAVFMLTWKLKMKTSRCHLKWVILERGGGGRIDSNYYWNCETLYLSEQFYL